MNAELHPPEPLKILEALADPASTLASVAALFHTSPEALVAWLACPEAAKLAADFEAAALLHARLIAARQLPAVLASIQRIAAQNPSESTTLRAASLLLRFARLQPQRAPQTDRTTRPSDKASDFHPPPHPLPEPDQLTIHEPITPSSSSAFSAPLRPLAAAPAVPHHTSFGTDRVTTYTADLPSRPPP